MAAIPLKKFIRNKKGGSHYYDRNGKPCHKIKCKTKDSYRPTTIRDARELGLFPSVTGILGVIKGDGLINWKEQKLIHQCFLNPKKFNETLEDYSSRMKDLTDIEKAKAPQLGTNIHAALELYFTSGKIEQEYAEYIRLVINWLSVSGITFIECEKRILPKFNAYGGTVDYLGLRHTIPVIIDFKTKQTKGKKIVQWVNNTAQLVAYMDAVSTEPGYATYDDAMLYNLYISTDEPGRIESHLCDISEIREGRRYFNHCFNLWQIINRYILEEV